MQLSSLTKTVLRSLTTCLLLGSAAPALAQSITLSQSFTGTTAPGWTITSTRWGSADTHAGLTAAQGIDPAGDGWLRLTDLNGDETGAARYTAGSFSPTNGLIIEFDYVIWGGPVDSDADGLSVYLYDAAKNMAGARFGASLGYCGGAGGYIGVGLDEWGNFDDNSADTERCDYLGNSGPGRTRQTVTVRGPTVMASVKNPYGSGNVTLGNNAFVTTVKPTTALDSPAVTSRTAARADKARIVLVPRAAGGYYLTVQLNQDGAGYVTWIDRYAYPYAAPASLSLGFGASTGASINYHELRNVMVRVPVDVGTTKTLQSGSSLTPGGTVKYTVTFSNKDINTIDTGVQGITLNSSNGPRLVDALPAGLTNATWTCSATALSTCPAPSGSGTLDTTAYTLAPGGTLTFTFTATLASSGTCGTTLTNTSQVIYQATSGLSDSNPSNDTAQVNSAVSACPQPPNVTLTKYVRNTRLSENFTTVQNTALPGDIVQYCITFTNTGGSTAQNFKLTDPFPSNVQVPYPTQTTDQLRWKLLYSAPATNLSNQSTSPNATPLPIGATQGVGLVGPNSVPGMSFDLGSAGLPAGQSGVVCFDSMIR